MFYIRQPILVISCSVFSFWESIILKTGSQRRTKKHFIFPLWFEMENWIVHIENEISSRIKEMTAGHLCTGMKPRMTMDMVLIVIPPTMWGYIWSILMHNPWLKYLVYFSVVSKNRFYLFAGHFKTYLPAFSYSQNNTGSILKKKTWCCSKVFCLNVSALCSYDLWTLKIFQSLVVAIPKCPHTYSSNASPITQSSILDLQPTQTPAPQRTPICLHCTAPPY